MFSKSDHRGLLLLQWLAILVLAMLWVYSNKTPPTEKNGDGVVSDSLSRNRYISGYSSRTYTYAVPEVSVESFPFDPNTADSTTLLRLGLSPWQVQNVYRYRASGGRYHTPEDFKRLYGMTQELWDRLGKFVTIDKKFQYLEVSPRKTYPRTKTSIPQSAPSLTADTVSADTFRIPPTLVTDTVGRYPEKFQKLTQVDINTADTVLLKKIPNIGSFRAGKIVAYREQLGGYTHVEQVMESSEMPDEVLEWFSIVPQPIKMINVNDLTIRQLMRHPYISFYQARNIVEHRKEYGPLKQIEDLLSLKDFTQKDIDRLRPYLVFQ